jgi:hypothetical protein
MQKATTAILNLRAHNRLESTSADIDRARILSAAGPGAAGFLVTMPNETGGYWVNRDWTTAIAFRLGLEIPLLKDLVGKKCTCGGTIDGKGHHVVGVCGQLTGERHIRHTFIKDVTGDIYRQAGAAVTTNPERTLGDLGHHGPPEERNKKIDVYALFPDGRVECTDNTHPHPCAATYIRAAQTAGGTAALAESKKRSKYADICAQVGAVFTPLVGETYERWGLATVKKLRKLARTVAEKSDAPWATQSTVMGMWWRRLSCVLQRGNVASVNSRVCKTLRAHQQESAAQFDWREAGNYMRRV